MKTFSWGVIYYQTKTISLAGCQVLPLPISDALPIIPLHSNQTDDLHFSIHVLRAELDSASQELEVSSLFSELL